MGVEKNLGFDNFPKQGSYLRKDVRVCFNYDTSKQLRGKIVRDDIEEPYVTLIELEDGRYVLAGECHYQTL